MTARQIIVATKKKGIELKTDGRDLVYRAPAGAMSSFLLAEIKRNKFDLLRLLKGRADFSAKNSEKISCLSGQCSHVIFRNRSGLPSLWCSAVKQRVCDLYDSTGCPKNKWQKFRTYSNDKHLKKTECYACHSKHLWKKHDHDGNWICAVCHPPAIPEDEIIWLE